MSGSDLDRFMLACSDLNQPARSRLFQNRPGLKDIKVQPRPAASSAAFQTSQKARDWSQLDLGDAFSQATPPLPPPLAASQTSTSSDADWDEFAEFQSCPPPPPPPVPAGSGSVVSVHSANAPGSVTSLLNGLSAAAAGGGGGDALLSNGLAPCGAASAPPLGYPGAPVSGRSAAPPGQQPAALAGYPVPTARPLSAPHPGPSSQQNRLSALPSVLGSLPGHPGTVSGQGALRNGFFPPGAASSSGLTAGWPVPAEPIPAAASVPALAAAAGYTPVPAVQPAAKPTRFRQGLVPLPTDPDEDEFAEFVAAEPAPGALPSPADRRRLGGAAESARGGRPGRLPTLDDSPPPRAASPPSEDLYAALRGLSTAPAAGGELLSGGRAQDLLGLDVLAADLPLPLSSAPGHLVSVPAPAPAPAPVSFSTSLGPAMNDFSTSLALPPPLGSLAPAPGDLCTPLGVQLAPAPAGLIGDEDEDFGEFVSVEQPVAVGGSAPLAEGALSAVSSRHGSLPSLDLQVAPSSDGGEVSPLEPDRREADSDAAATAKHDKYDSFRQEIMSPPSSESALVAEWRRCLQACYELIQEGVALFGSVADQYTCSEVAGSRQGTHYIDNLSRVYRVAGRIERACERHGCRHQLDFILSETCKAWANLTAFVANSPTRPAVADGWPVDVAASPAGDSAPCCGVCLLPAGDASRDEPTLACAGRHYHACCANLWANRVADVLPALRP